MDIVTHVKTCLNTWSKGGEDECRKILSTPHTRVFDPECADVLITAYQTMLHASLHSWLGVSGTPFDIGNITAFVQGVLQSLPSTSSASSERSTNMSLFGELLVDLIWVIDGELDEVISDAKSALADNTLKDREINAKERVESVKKTAEGDKGRLAVFLKSLLNANIVVPPTCRERLEVPLLASAGLIPDEVLFGRKEVRMRTALFYKQNKFNLLREQSEGYTKLTTDLVGSLGPSHSPQTARPVESITALNARAAAAWEKVVALIGYFDLDANRVLDIILDIFSVNITTHWQFFLALLSYSQWSGESDFLKYQESPENIPLDQKVDQYRGKSLDEILEIAESSAKGYTTTRKSESNGKPKVLAQVLGFKFAYYLSSETSEYCPRGLYLMAALLIREGFISLEDLYPHLGPSDEDMSKVHQKYLNDVQARVSASANNLLTMAAPLESNSIPSSSVPSKPKPALTETKPVETKEPAVQKAMIASALLSVGCIQPALALMSKFPWLVDVHHELADLLLHILKASISPLFESLYHKEKVVGCLQPRARYVSAGVLTTPVRKPQLTLCFPPPPSTHTHDFVFFFPRWSDWIPICKSLGDIVDVIEPIMRFVRIYISRDPMFVAKLLRLGKLQLLQSIESCSGVKAAAEMPPILEPEDEIQEFWLRIARRYLLPTLSMMSGNALFLVEIWQVLKLYDVSLRWGLYEEWRNVTYKSHPELNAQRIVIEREAKGILRRLSIKSESLSGTVAKMVHTNPIIFFTIALNQVQSYSNLSDVVLSSLKYCTIMGLDILVFLLLEALASPHKERVKEDGTNISDWLQNLASFTGDFFNRNSAINHATVLQYIVHQLLQGQTSDIIVLEKLIEKVSGVETLPGGVKDSQIAIMAGGPVLRTEYFSSRIRKEDNKDKQLENSIRKTPRLGKNLIETGLTFPILVQVAQQRQACVYNAKDPHLKSIASLFDTTHLVLFQYLEFLTSPDGIPLDEYRKSIPSLAELCNTYGISQPIAMQIIRPLLNDAVLKHAKQWKKQKEERAKAAEKRLKAALAAKRDPNSVLAIDSPNQADVPSDQNGTTSPDKMDVDTASARPQDKQNGNTEVETPQLSPWIEELSSLFDMCRAIAPGNVNDVVGPAFYLTFWQLSSYDLYYPKNIYIEVDKNLISEYDDLNVQLRQADRSPDKKQRALVTILRQKRDRLVGVINEFRKEKPAQEEVYQFTTEVDGRLEREKNHWFPHIGKGSAALIQSLIEHCFQPRCLLSPMDAVFCAQFIKTLHERGTPGFHTLMCYDKLLGDHVKVVIFSCSENEARNFGRFLKMILSDLHAWHKDQKVFEASNHRKVGTEQILLPGLQVHWSKDGPSSPDDLLKWADLKSFLRKCHRKLGQSFTDCLKAGDFMHVYNALLVLKEIIEVFPLASVNDVVGSKVDLEVQKLVETEERGDVKALARAYAASLKKREKLWAMPKSSQPVKPPGPKASPSLPNPTPIPDRPREQAVVTPPSGPRAITAAAPVVQKLPDQVTPPDRPASAARLAIESIPRPEVVKRNRDSKPPEAPAANIMKESRSNHMQVDSTPPQNQNNPQAVIVEDRQRTEPANAVPQHPPLRPAVRAGHPVNDLRKEVLQGMNNPPRPATPQSSSQMPQNGTRDLPQSPRGREREPGSPSMAPPVAPSQTLVAQELRSSRRGDRSMRTDLSPRRSSSPASRPGTRNASSDSRASGESKKEKARHDRGLEPEAEDSKRAVNVEAPSRAERGSGAHRDSLQTRSERAGRDRIPGSSTRDTDRERDRDSDRDRGRDREKDRDRERDRDREKRSRGERESHRERDRDRDRSDRDHERRRRDEKERDRKSSASTKEQESVNEHGLPSRPDTSRHRTEEAHGGKRKRGADDEPERSNKSRHREGKHRKTSEKESSREQRRKDRDADNEPSTKLSTNERLPESQRLNDSKLTPLKVNTSLPPTGPRDRNLGQSPGPSSTRDRERERERDNDRDRSGRDRNERNGRGGDRQERLERESWPERERNERGGGDRAREWKMNPAASNAAAASPSASGSLRDRIGDLGNTAGRNSADGASSRDEQNERLKRSLSDRDRDVAHEPPTDTSGTSQSKGTQKRPRIINRARYDNGPGRIAQGALNGLSR